MARVVSYSEHIKLQDALLRAAQRNDGKAVMRILAKINEDEHLMFGDTAASRRKAYYLVQQVLKGQVHDADY